MHQSLKAGILGIGSTANNAPVAFLSAVMTYADALAALLLRMTSRSSCPPSKNSTLKFLATPTPASLHRTVICPAHRQRLSSREQHSEEPSCRTSSPSSWNRGNFSRCTSLRLNRTSQDCCRSVFTMVPSTEQLCAEQFSDAVQLMLGLPALPHAPSVCPLCNTNIAGNACHLIGCAMMRRSALTKRHDGIAKCLHAFFERHLPSQLEPRVGRRATHARCHQRLHLPPARLLVSPVEATYVQRKSEDAFAALAHGNNERSPSTLRLHAKLAFSLSHSS